MSCDQCSDAHLVKLARRGCQRSWSALVARHGAALTATARRHRLNDADAADAVQTTWLRCMEHVDRIRSPDRIRSWLLTTCRRECLRILRDRARSVATDPLVPGALGEPDALCAPPDPGESVLTAEVRRILNRALEDLPERQRLVIHELLVVDHPTRGWYASVAERLRMPIGSLGPNRQRALRRLRHNVAVAALRPA